MVGIRRHKSISAQNRKTKRKHAMIRFELLKDAGVLVIEPQSALSGEDFREISRAIDPYIRDKGKPTGLLIEARAFPGWDSFGALLEHFKFVYHHHRNIDRVAAVTDSAFFKIAPTTAQHFAHPDIRVFASGERVKALEWLQTGAQLPSGPSTAWGAARIVETPG
jgi:hypothetical protein